MKDECATIIRGGSPCKAIAVWRCRFCYRTSCGIHVDRVKSGIRCTYCSGELHQFRRRIGGGPINSSSADDLTRSINESRAFARAALKNHPADTLRCDREASE
jgi:hypothetical protein